MRSESEKSDKQYCAESQIATNETLTEPQRQVVSAAEDSFMSAVSDQEEEGQEMTENPELASNAGQRGPERASSSRNKGSETGGEGSSSTEHPKSVSRCTNPKKPGQPPCATMSLGAYMKKGLEKDRKKLVSMVMGKSGIPEKGNKPETGPRSAKAGRPLREKVEKPDRFGYKPT